MGDDEEGDNEVGEEERPQGEEGRVPVVGEPVEEEGERGRVECAGEGGEDQAGVGGEGVGDCEGVRRETSDAAGGDCGDVVGTDDVRWKDGRKMRGPPRARRK